MSEEARLIQKISTCSVLDWQYWTNWIPQFIVALGTLGAVIVALFGGWIRHYLVPPKLKLSLLNSCGELSPIILSDQIKGTSRQTNSRWYHLRVSNDRRWSPAKNVQVFITRLETKNAADEYKLEWDGEFPLRWRHQEINPVTRTVGHAIDCDLCCVVLNKWVKIQTLSDPFVPNTFFRDSCDIICTFKAHGIDVDSNAVRIQIIWDGKWSENNDDMANHMIVRELLS